MNDDQHDFAQLVIDYVSQPKYQPVKPRVLAKKLGVPEDQQRELRKTIKRLVKGGQLTWGAKHLVRLPDDQPPPKRDNHVTGLFSRVSTGDGYVRPEGTPRSAGRERDIYIPRKRAQDASTGDQVVVRVSRRRGKKGQQTGDVIEIVQRESRQFVGTYFEDAGSGFVQVDGDVFSRPIYVGDAHAKGAGPSDKVVIEMVRYPSHVQEGEGVVVETLGPRGAPGVDTATVIREFDLPDEFPADVRQNAREQADKFDEAMIEGRDDITGIPTLTIDPEDARDFDDAVSLERLDQGHWRLGVHIADVSHFVPRGSALDAEARRRGTSVYLPDRVLPMLPEVVSNHLASLQPNRVRYTKTAWIEFTEDGAVVATDLANTAIRSDRRFTYEEVDDFLGNRKKWRGKLDPPLFELLSNMHELAMILRKRRLERGALELTMPEVKIDLDESGRACGAHVVENTESHQIIEEFMLAANEAVAQRLADDEIIFLRRVHQQPELRKLKAATVFVRELGIDTESLESRFAIQKALKEVEGDPRQRAVNYAILRSMQKAVYSPDEEGHYALSSPCYCHFTSPIRRYPDLTVHRILDDLFSRRRPVMDLDALAALGAHCSDREQRAERAERELVKIKLLNLLHDQIGLQMDAVVTGVEAFGAFVQGVELPAEGLVHISTLQDDTYEFDRSTHSLTGRRSDNQYRLGDLVRVEIVHVDVDRRELDFRIVKRAASRKAVAAETKRKKKKSKKGPKKTKRGRKG